MAKIKIKSVITANEMRQTNLNTFGILKDNMITFKDNDVIVNITLLKNNIIIKRENDDKCLILNFVNNKKVCGTYLIKSLNLNILVETITKELIINNDNLLIKYELFMNNEYSDTFTYKMNWSLIK